eukprot:TRINITY_DN7348_c0_g1_i9.p1 TRINITY_DN7348_c0_g1~~TRINITY_DN7348_c0_g1_i9.p1  ORF type:complete len:199 (-),score=20.76 TRINITY_DN7348_c0_g1_i9:194-790(-)
MHPTHSVGSNPLSAFRRNLPLASKTSSHKPFLGRANSKMEIKANEYAQNSLPSIVLNKLVMVENGNAVVERQRPAAKLKILQMRRMRKINRLFNTIRNISLLSNKSNDSSYYINPVDVTESKRRRALKSLRANKALENARKTTLAHTKDNLKKLVNNDSSYLLDDAVSVKQKLVLGSMQTTFLCSKYCRFQPLLNVFK